MTPKVPDTLLTRFRYRWYRLCVGRYEIPMTYSLFRQTLWMKRPTRRTP
jgi:hypothetical protein